MDVEFLDAGSVAAKLNMLMAEYATFHWAVAWGHETPAAVALLKHKAKFASVTFGVAFGQTDPKLVTSLIDVRGAYLATDFAAGTYHPKVYGFRTGNKVAAVVGSANFTHGGLGRNLEAAIAMVGTIDEPALAKLFEFLREAERHHQPITRELAERYAASCKRIARLPRPPRDPLAGVDKLQVRSLSSLVTLRSWADYRDQVHASAHHDVGRSLDLLSIAQRWLVGARSFSDLTSPQRKAIAGILGEYQKSDDELDRDWGWFGSMKGAGDFANRVEENDRQLALAVDAIPQRGEVTRVDYDRFCEHFVRAFARSARTGGVATASRLLALKRPDSFLCICSPNISQAAADMGFAKSTLDLDNYWERVVEVLRAAEWYNAPRPKDADARLWDNRAAMLDAIYYRP